jgi:hypothetical protein
MSQADALPSVGYLVKADEYFLLAYVLLCALVVKTVGVNWLHRSGRVRTARWTDKGFLAAFVPGALVGFTYLTLEGMDLLPW